MKNSSCATEITASRTLGMILLPFAVLLSIPLMLMVPVLGLLAAVGVLAIAAILTVAPRGRACRLPTRA